MQSAGILLIDDDRRLAEMVGRYLGQAGFSVQVQGTARAGLEALAERTPDLILLDLMLPDGDGLDVCRQIRQRGGLAARVPILMLTARGETTDRVVGLEVGADDYLPKPFEPRELLARVRALLRRAAPVDVSSGGAAGTGGWISRAGLHGGVRRWIGRSGPHGRCCRFSGHRQAGRGSSCRQPGCRDCGSNRRCWWCRCCRRYWWRW